MLLLPGVDERSGLHACFPNVNKAFEIFSNVVLVGMTLTGINTGISLLFY